MTTTFKVMHTMPYNMYATHESIIDLKLALAEFGNIAVRTQELMGAAIWVVAIQFDDDDLAVMFKLKYGSDYDATTMDNEDFHEGHKIMYLGG